VLPGPSSLVTWVGAPGPLSTSQKLQLQMHASVGDANITQELDCLGSNPSLAAYSHSSYLNFQLGILMYSFMTATS
jgi:hypothetical protein